ncbi:MAG TPA: cyanoexosortase A [Oculatellaceae cyanobacterium]|jgi:cyanoexosortase A
MRTINHSLIKSLNTYQFWLLTLAGGLIAINLSLQMKLTGDFIYLSFSLLLWGVVLSQLWKKRHTLNLSSGVFSTSMGLGLIAFILLRSLFTARVSLLFAFSPVLSALGLMWLASGFRGFKQYGQELLLIVVLSIPESLVSQLFDPSNLTANFATYILSHFGFKAYFQGINIVLNTGSVEVLQQCSGLVNMLLLWQLAMFFIVIFPTDLAKKIFVPVVGVVVGFIINAVRVAILTVLITNSQEEAFHYWHDGNGAQLFVLMSVVVFGVFCYFLVENEPANPEPI